MPEEKHIEKREKISSTLILSGMLILAIVFSVITIARGTTPNPGHPWTDVGDGFWAATGTTALRTFTFPNASGTVLTDVNDVTPAQGGTGTSTLPAGLVLQGNGTNTVTGIATGTLNNILTASTTGWISAPPGFEFLGSVKLGSAAATTGALTIGARDILLVAVRVIGYSGGGDIASFRFNGDSGSTYWSRYITSVASGVTLVNQQNVSQTVARLFGLTATNGRSAWITISNNAATSKLGQVDVGINTATGAAGTAGVIQIGGFEWVNTSAQITSIELRTAGGQTMTAGSGFAVYGRNL